MKLSIVVPCYNEEKTIGIVIDKLKKIDFGIEKEIIIVDDGSIDKSNFIINTKKGIKILKHEKNMGKGAAIKTALKELKGDLFIVQDADLELDPNQIKNVIKPIIENKALVVYGSRRPNMKRVDHHPFFYFGGMLVTFITNFIYNTKLTDEPCGYKAFRTNVLKNVKINENGFGWEPEVTGKIAKRGIKIHEVPIKNFNSRSSKEGKKLKPKDGFKAIWILFKYKLID